MGDAIKLQIKYLMTALDATTFRILPGKILQMPGNSKEPIQRRILLVALKQTQKI